MISPNFFIILSTDRIFLGNNPFCLACKELDVQSILEFYKNTNVRLSCHRIEFTQQKFFIFAIKTQPIKFSTFNKEILLSSEKSAFLFKICHVFFEQRNVSAKLHYFFRSSILLFCFFFDYTHDTPLVSFATTKHALHNIALDEISHQFPKNYGYKKNHFNELQYNTKYLVAFLTPQPKTAIKSSKETSTFCSLHSIRNIINVTQSSVPLFPTLRIPNRFPQDKKFEESEAPRCYQIPKTAAILIADRDETKSTKFWLIHE